MLGRGRAMTTLPVNEIFATMQGEGAYTGTPSVFVRLQGCPVGCPWCDTKHTWPVDAGDQIPAAEMLEKIADAPTWAEMSSADIVAAIRAASASPEPGHVVITGGEPALYDLVELSTFLLDAGYEVQLETSGTHPLRIIDEAFVTVAPKVGMPGGFSVRLETLERADEIKMPVGKQEDIDRLLHLLELLGADPLVFLAPISQSRKATELCMAAAARHGWRVSLQTHKFIGVR